VFVSLHRYPHYPGTGYRSEANCLNFPLPAECGEAAYLKTLKEAIDRVDLDRVEVVAVSAGFDTFAGDLASLGLRVESFVEIGRIIADIGKPTFFVLEGGYVGENIGRAVDAMLRSF
ncbi:histone deacetylase family protein, partial [Candidatus Bathyarchaeota archaeon]|nr:histone deacetylase family protein [Candidatus Bathyarchaeota archaeon]